MWVDLCFQPADVTIVKAMKNPPAGVKLVMAAVCVMKDIKPEKINDPSGTGQKVKSKSSQVTCQELSLFLSLPTAWHLF